MFFSLQRYMHLSPVASAPRSVISVPIVSLECPQNGRSSDIQRHPVTSSWQRKTPEKTGYNAFCLRFRAASSAGRAPRSQRGGRGFESHAVHHRFHFLFGSTVVLCWEILEATARLGNADGPKPARKKPLCRSKTQERLTPCPRMGRRAPAVTSPRHSLSGPLSGLQILYGVHRHGHMPAGRPCHPLDTLTHAVTLFVAPFHC